MIHIDVRNKIQHKVIDGAKELLGPDSIANTQIWHGVATHIHRGVEAPVWDRIRDLVDLEYYGESRNDSD